MSAAPLGKLPIYFGTDDRPLFGWFHPPAASLQRPMGVLLCNPIGEDMVRAHRPFRHLAETLAAAGFPVVRFDYDGTGLVWRRARSRSRRHLARRHRPRGERAPHPRRRAVVGPGRPQAGWHPGRAGRRRSRGRGCAGVMGRLRRRQCLRRRIGEGAQDAHHAGAGELLGRPARQRRTGSTRFPDQHPNDCGAREGRAARDREGAVQTDAGARRRQRVAGEQRPHQPFSHPWKHHDLPAHARAAVPDHRAQQRRGAAGGDRRDRRVAGRERAAGRPADPPSQRRLERRSRRHPTRAGRLLRSPQPVVRHPHQPPGGISAQTCPRSSC